MMLIGIDIWPMVDGAMPQSTLETFKI